MSTSGSITFNQTRDQIITDSLSLLQVLAAGETANSNDITFCANIMNKMLKGWEAQGIHLWTQQDGTLFLVNNQYKYILQAGASGANASDGTGTPIETTLSANGSGSSITVTSATGMSVSDNIGIQLNNNTIQWTTISSVNTSTNVVGLNASLTSAASSGNQVFTYTTQCPRVLSIQNARIRDGNLTDIQMKIVPLKEYNSIVQKTITGRPIILCYSPQLTQGLVYVWPTPNDVSMRIEFTYLRTIQDMVNSTDNVDLPVEWLEAITYNLAVRVASAYGINLSSGGITGNPDILRQAAQYLDDLKTWDAEQPYIRLIPNRYPFMK